MNLGKIFIFASDIELRHNISLGFYFLIYIKTGLEVLKYFSEKKMAEYIFPKEILLRTTTYNTKADLFLLKGTESPLLAPSPTPRLQENYETHCTK